VRRVWEFRVRWGVWAGGLWGVGSEEGAGGVGGGGGEQVFGPPRFEDEPVNLAVVDGVHRVLHAGGAGEQDAGGSGDGSADPVEEGQARLGGPLQGGENDVHGKLSEDRSRGPGGGGGNH